MNVEESRRELSRGRAALHHAHMTRPLFALLLSTFALLSGCGGDADSSCGCYEGTSRNIGPGGTPVTIQTCTEKSRGTQKYCDCTTSDSMTQFTDQPVCS